MGSIMERVALSLIIRSNCMKVSGVSTTSTAKGLCSLEEATNTLVNSKTASLRVTASILSKTAAATRDNSKRVRDTEPVFTNSSPESRNKFNSSKVLSFNERLKTS